jgi:FixJ family two-component response regulator
MPGLVYIVDDDASFRTSTSRLLRACGYTVETYESAEHLLENLKRHTSSGCILLDIRMAGVTGLEAQEVLRATGSRLPIIFVTGHADIPTAVQVIKGGAEDLLTKPTDRDRLVQAIERALARGRLTQDDDEKLAGWRRLVSRLTPRERQVFERVVRGALNKQIAYELGSTERTIKAHRQHVMQKLQVRSFAELVLMAERLGLITETGQPPSPDARVQRAESEDPLSRRVI